MKRIILAFVIASAFALSQTPLPSPVAGIASGAASTVPYSGITGLTANEPLYGGAAGVPSQSPNWLFVDPLLTLNNPGIGSTPTDSMLLSNSTAAAAGAQQFSPAIRETGQGWVLLTAPSAPTSGAPTSGGSCTAGTHVWAYTFVNAAGETTIGSNSSAQTCGANATVPLTVIAAGPTGTTARKVYQSLAGTTTPLYLLTTLANNTTTTYSAATADGSLGAVSPASNTTGNSQSVSFRSFVTPVQGTTANGSYWGLYSSIAGGAYSNLISVLPSGNVGIGTTTPPAQLSLGGNISHAAWTTNGIGLANVPRTLTDTTSSGTVAAAYTDVLGGNTVAASSATTYTNYYSMYVNAPVAGTNVTMTNKYALGADSLVIGTGTPFTVGTNGVFWNGQLSFSNSSPTITNTNGNGPINIGNQTMTTSVTGVLSVVPTFTNTSGNSSVSRIAPTYNQASGSGNNTDLLVNRTETAIMSGTQLFADFQVAGVSKASLDHLGNLTLPVIKAASTSQPVCVTSTGLLELGSVIAGAVTCP